MPIDQETPSTPLDGPQLFEPGDLVDQRYEVVRLIAHGGMGLVYEVVDRDLASTLALKAVKPHIARQSQTLDRFRREIRLSSRVTHPNVCRLFGAGLHRESSGLEVHYLTMEFLEGETLSRRLRESGSLKVEEAGPILHQMANGLAAAHRAGVVHRDLKCSNVILVPQDDPKSPWRAVITDFGLSRSLIQEEETSRLTATGQLMGTPAYFAPELLDGHRLTAASDIYGFGVVAYEMLSGRLPFTGRSPFVVALRRLSEPPRPIRQLVPNLDRHWVRVLDRCLQRRPENRPAHGDALLELLDRGDEGAATDPEMRSKSFEATLADPWDLDAELAPLLEDTLDSKTGVAVSESVGDLWGSAPDSDRPEPTEQAPADRPTTGSNLRRLLLGGVLLLAGALLTMRWWAPESPSPGPERLAILVANDAEEPLRGAQLQSALTWATTQRHDLELISPRALAPLTGDVAAVARAVAADEVLVSRLLPTTTGWQVELERLSEGGARRVWARELSISQDGTRLLAHAISEALGEAFVDHPPRDARWDPLQQGGEAFDDLLDWSLSLERWVADPGSVDPPSTEALESIRRRSGDAPASRRLEARWRLALARRSDTPRDWRLARGAFLALDPRTEDLAALFDPLPIDPSTQELDLLRALFARDGSEGEENPESCDTLRLEGFLDLHSGDPEAARRSLRSAVEACPSWDLLADLGRVEVTLGDLRAAHDSYTRALALAPEVEALQQAVTAVAPRVER